MNKLRVAIAGSSQNSQKMAEALAHDEHFVIAWILTPSPKPIGRHQTLTANPLDVWADSKQIKKINIGKKIDQELKEKINQEAIDLLLVVDFGYLIPDWLLDLPKIAPLNIHPSLLPLWRGSSPGQFAILWQDLTRPWQNQVIGGKNSAITLMKMNSALDEGDLISQIPFSIDDNWTQEEYYQHAFDLMAKQLAAKVLAFSQGKIEAQSQKKQSPSPIARRLKKADSFISWEKLLTLMNKNENTVAKSDSDSEVALLEGLLLGQGCLGDYPLTRTEQINLIINASRAFHPWPGLWTIIPGKENAKKMKILTCHLEKDQTLNYLVLDQVQVEGKTATCFSDLQLF